MFPFLKIALLFLLAVSVRNGATAKREDHLNSGNKLLYHISDDGSYSFHAGSSPSNFFLDSGGAFVQADKMMYSSTEGSLKLTGTKAVSGSDSTGTYNGKLFQYTAGQSRMMAEVAVYNNGEFVRFSQSFPDGLKDCNVSDASGLLSGFPMLKFGKNSTNEDLGFLALYGDFCGYDYAISDLKWNNELIRGGEKAGPIVLFDKYGRVMILSSYKNFMTHNVIYDSEAGLASFGIMGGVKEVPKYYQIDTLLYYSENGINRAIEKWGQVLLTRYNKKRSFMETDLTANYLGYNTERGAYYYYKTVENKTYEETILEVIDYAKVKNIPYGYLQYDSWWYYKGIDEGVKTWTSRPEIFPNGMNYLFEKHGLPTTAHNRYWAADTTYAKKNGGKYNFWVEETKAIPIDQVFWKDLMRASKPWGLVTYEQDWLITEFVEMKITHSNISVARDWMMQMGEGCAESDVTIQYCMAMPRHMLQSVEISVVTQARVSADYHPGNSKWKLGVTSIFAHALNLAPYKDTHWTTSVQPGSPYGYLDKEPHTALQTAISTLSTGPVGVGDAIGYTDVPLLMKCCREDGLILKPSRAITATDENILKLAFPNQIPGASNTKAEIYSTYSDLKIFSGKMNDCMRFGIFLAAGLTRTSYKVNITAMYLNDVNPLGATYVAYQGYPGTDSKIYTISANNQLIVPPCGMKDFQLWHFAPVTIFNDTNTFALLGERSKWVPVSQRRIRHIEINANDILLEVVGKSMEVVSVDCMVNGRILTTTCKLAADGTRRMSVIYQKCLYH